MDRKQAEAIAAAVLEQPAAFAQRPSFGDRFSRLVLVVAAGAIGGALLARLGGGLLPVWAFLGAVFSSAALLVVRTLSAARRLD